MLKHVFLFRNFEIKYDFFAFDHLKIFRMFDVCRYFRIFWNNFDFLKHNFDVIKTKNQNVAHVFMSIKYVSAILKNNFCTNSILTNN